MRLPKEPHDLATRKGGYNSNIKCRKCKSYRQFILKDGSSSFCLCDECNTVFCRDTCYDVHVCSDHKNKGALMVCSDPERAKALLPAAKRARVDAADATWADLEKLVADPTTLEGQLLRGTVYFFETCWRPEDLLAAPPAVKRGDATETFFTDGGPGLICAGCKNAPGPLAAITKDASGTMSVYCGTCVQARRASSAPASTSSAPPSDLPDGFRIVRTITDDEFEMIKAFYDKLGPKLDRGKLQEELAAMKFETLPSTVDELAPQFADADALAKDLALFSFPTLEGALNGSKLKFKDFTDTPEMRAAAAEMIVQHAMKVDEKVIISELVAADPSAPPKILTYLNTMRADEWRLPFQYAGTSEKTTALLIICKKAVTPTHADCTDADNVACAVGASSSSSSSIATWVMFSWRNASLVNEKLAKLGVKANKTFGVKAGSGVTATNLYLANKIPLDIFKKAAVQLEEEKGCAIIHIIEQHARDRMHVPNGMFHAVYTKAPSLKIAWDKYDKKNLFRYIVTAHEARGRLGGLTNSPDYMLVNKVVCSLVLEVMKKWFVPV